MIQNIVCEKLGGFPGYEFWRNMAMSNFYGELKAKLSRWNFDFQADPHPHPHSACNI